MKRLPMIGLIAAACVGLVGAWAGFYDTILLVTLIGGLGLLSARRDRAALCLAGLLIGGGLLWSSQDVSGCSLWYRGRVAAAKATGELGDASWSEIGRHVTMMAPCLQLHPPEAVGEREVEGHHYVQIETSAGKFWNAEGDESLIGGIVRSVFDEREYETPEVEIHPGDVVIDAGAHVGIFSTYALSRGAAKVIAIEPVPENVWCIRQNLAEEIAAGKVVVVQEGVWNERDEIALAHSHHNSAQHSFVVQFDDDVEYTTAPVRPLDEIVEELELGKIDFVKFDIEGAERNAIEGARKVIERHQPRLAVASYHRTDDPTAIPAALHAIEPRYAAYRKKFVEVGPSLAAEILHFRVEE